MSVHDWYTLEAGKKFPRPCRPCEQRRGLIRDGPSDDPPTAVSFQPDAHELQREAALGGCVGALTGHDGGGGLGLDLQAVHDDLGELRALAGAVGKRENG
jgi:hypothetical protein